MIKIKVSNEIGCWCVYDYIFTPGIYEIDDERVIEAIKSEPRITIIEELEDSEVLEPSIIESEDSEVLEEVEIQKDEKLNEFGKYDCDIPGCKRVGVEGFASSVSLLRHKKSYHK